MPDGRMKLVPATMKKVTYYMCTRCLEKGAKWPDRPKRWK
jgi:hypothetical protein